MVDNILIEEFSNDVGCGSPGSLNQGTGSEVFHGDEVVAFVVHTRRNRPGKVYGEGVEEASEGHVKVCAVLRDCGGALASYTLLYVFVHVTSHAWPPVTVNHKLPARLRVPVADAVVEGVGSLGTEGLRKNNLKTKRSPTEKLIVPDKEGVGSTTDPAPEFWALLLNLLAAQVALYLS